ncbi:uncharacterized protein E0L32_010946 [Thyridium curvatum]|uniref:Protection of telomeres protein 1 n=1 Tax=Thyridium curvatum TaxID=1093900 RepID=A0A507ADL4_9PEZI|nr:uncharacterized protein E0L32_010946 [Thyridium curvatum]TPX07145.1 hypothetical protein E0L32_010946 [Thyridium curvatum]
MPLTKPSGSGSVPPSSQRLRSVPAGVVELNDIFDGKLSRDRIVNAVGLVSDVQSPIKTKGTDYKMTLTLFDASCQHNGRVKFVIFRPSEEEMPQIDNANDVVLIVAAKVQHYNGEYSLICNRRTGIFVYSGPRIPKPPNSAEPALITSGNKQPSREPTVDEHNYVSRLLHRIDPSYIPLQHSLEEAKSRSRNIKSKFSTLADVRDMTFCDLIVQVVREPYLYGDKATLWVTDYTENPAFYSFSYKGGELLERDGDEYGYLGHFSVGTKKEWTGPYGQRSMQVTCFDSHASTVDQSVKEGSWLSLRNVHIKFGKNGNNLEGFLRGDENAYEQKIQVTVLRSEGDAENVSPLLKDAVRRKLEYEVTKKAQVRALKEECQGQGRKRKAENEQPTKKENAKSRRKKERDAKFAAKACTTKPKEQETEETESQEPQIDLNAHVRCEHHKQRASLLSSVLKPVYHETTLDGQEHKLRLPFINANYRAHVRVVDFLPDRLENFAVGRVPTEFDMLSDWEGDSSSSGGSDTEGSRRRSRSRRIWEWRFALRLQDAAPVPDGDDGPRPASLWVVVDNSAAQLLTGLDASNLRYDERTLAALREKMFTLWGDLEEKKAGARQRQEAARKRNVLLRPPPVDASSDVEASPQRKAKEMEKGGQPDEEEGEDDDAAVRPMSSQARNKAFTCCIQQYGVKVKAESEQEANVGDGKHKWERVFGLFGTKIAG